MTSAPRYEEIRQKIAEDLNKTISTNYESLLMDWETTGPDVAKHFFYYDDEYKLVTRYDYKKEVWSPLIKAYVSWFGVPEKNMSSLWRDIIHCMLSTPNFEVVATDSFKAWAYGCTCKWALKKWQGSNKFKRSQKQRDSFQPLWHGQSMQSPDSLATRTYSASQYRTNPQGHPGFAIPAPPPLEAGCSTLSSCRMTGAQR
jgi:hypothetical protein